MEKSQFNSLIEKGFNHIPLSREVLVDTDTPLALYLKLANNPYSYFLESVQGGEKWGRYSFVGLAAETVIKVNDYDVSIEKNGKLHKQYKVEDPLAWIEDYQSKFKVPQLEELPDFNGGLVGYFGYEIIKFIEPKLKNIKKKDELNVPDILLMVSNDLLVVDNLTSKVHIITHINPEKESFEAGLSKLNIIEKNIRELFNFESTSTEKIESEDFVSSFGKENFVNAVEKVQKYITAGDVMQVVPSQRLSCSFKSDPIELYRQLRILNPSPYMYFLNLDGFAIVGSSPEILTRVDNNNVATIRPIAGTRSRGKNIQEDLENEKDLLSDEKEIAEHLMLIDLGRNDLGRIAKTGSVNLTDKMFIERYSHVMHIVSNVECELKEDMSSIDVLKATFPAGTLSGAPKVRAMEIIDEVETLKRNIYSGAIGNLSWHGGMDLAIAIRTAVIKDEVLYVQAGAGIVYDSIPEMEWQETMDKAQALIKAAQNI
ncbi:anthranilate synthase component I [Candidatus Pseudothioglobus singularis]|uniref:anthranilate synthase component I n=1 Tax=Candidatus Pseudothioglobus singularis TaxID=1427364 RepID=UPI0008063224|nr:anthranilate synthase component I [Candidatus Pseudothioglobus singularis]ANQ66204.1 anthranilate synthase component I [Candidatus Pseudothioglobus singularis]